MAEQTCYTCREIIPVGKYLMANDRSYHPDCFKCQECSSSLIGIKYALNMQNNPICTNCAVNAIKKSNPNTKVTVVNANDGPSRVNTAPTPPSRDVYGGAKFCHGCGTKIVPGGRFCSSCGAQI